MSYVYYLFNQLIEHVTTNEQFVTVPNACTMPQWTVHLEGGPRRVNHAAVAVGDKIYTFGGYCTGEDYQTTRPMDVHVLNTGERRRCICLHLYM